MPGMPGMPGMPQQQMPQGMPQQMPQQQMPQNMQSGMQPQQTMSHQGVPIVQPASGDPVLELIKAAGLVKDSQIEEAQKMKKQVGGELVSLLVAQGAIKRVVKDAAVKCCGLIDKGTLKADHAHTLLKLCQSKDKKYEDAVEELGWRLG